MVFLIVFNNISRFQCFMQESKILCEICRTKFAKFRLFPNTRFSAKRGMGLARDVIDDNSSIRVQTVASWLATNSNKLLDHVTLSCPYRLASMTSRRSFPRIFRKYVICFVKKWQKQTWKIKYWRIWWIFWWNFAQLFLKNVCQPSCFALLLFTSYLENLPYRKK